ncbi:helix-turn-helix domain-containing protein [Pleionea litopenaei]|uniref:Helix-turn-helix domain-containing protein n=1 Tax=Pleionea litopenaei TaxID=3070815 RepID=A0AA51X5Q2_9GAMM|nr:helix-turn-helix domain-containing protein [Pleionea sp. HL-JVS1]WMS85916.1 helix-turn-helix domain-containing protein [Pleionea sp. HL-JVS1]
MDSIEQFSSKPFNHSSVEAIAAQNPYSEIFYRLWYSPQQQVTYHQENFHTFSYYLLGGENSFRKGNRSQIGGPGKICIMPQGSYSTWSVKKELKFVHVYLNVKEIGFWLERLFEIDARNFELQETIYDDNEKMQLCFKRLVFDQELNYSIFKEQWLVRFIEVIYDSYNAQRDKKLVYKGGLTRKQKSKLKNYINENIGEKLSLSKLANEINMSTFHFSREFMKSFGLPPAQYIQKLKMDRALTLLKSPATLSQISASLGYSHQSHFTQQFKKTYLTTPAYFRNAIN